MPPLPSNDAEADRGWNDKSLVVNFIRHSYGNNPMNPEAFAEIAAAYHAAKVLSVAHEESNGHARRVQAFADNVAETNSHAFLLSLLMRSESAVVEIKARGGLPLPGAPAPASNPPLKFEDWDDGPFYQGGKQDTPLTEHWTTNKEHAIAYALFGAERNWGDRTPLREGVPRMMEVRLLPHQTVKGGRRDHEYPAKNVDVFIAPWTQ
jgi:hypothetical protein